MEKPTPRTGIGQLIPSCLTLFLILIRTVEGNCSIGVIPTSYTINQDNLASLYCVTQGAEQTEWYYGRTLLSRDCNKLHSSYSVVCNQNERKYNLTFKATWSNRGLYTCSCLTSGRNVVVDVEVAIGSVDVTCVLQSTGLTCSEKMLESSDKLLITATTGCTYPDPSFTWYKNQSNFDVSRYNVKTSYIDCTGDIRGQRQSVQTFNATWGELGRFTKLQVLVERSRTASVFGSLSFSSGLVYGFAAAKVVGLILGVACGVAGITIGVVGLKKALSRNTVKPKPFKSENTEFGDMDNVNKASAPT